MKIEIIETNISELSNVLYIRIIELMVDAVRNYPIYGLDDTKEYFSEIRKVLNNNEINITNIDFYLQQNKNFVEDKTIWIIDSLSTLIDAFELMNLYKISFDEIQDVIDSLG